MSADIPVRLVADGDEVRCIVLAYSFEEARRALEPFASGIVGHYPFISAFGAKVNVHKLADLGRLPCVRAVAAHTTVTALDNNNFATLAIRPPVGACAENHSSPVDVSTENVSRLFARSPVNASAENVSSPATVPDPPTDDPPRPAYGKPVADSTDRTTLNRASVDSVERIPSGGVVSDRGSLVAPQIENTVGSGSGNYITPATGCDPGNFVSPQITHASGCGSGDFVPPTIAYKVDSSDRCSEPPLAVHTRAQNFADRISPSADFSSASGNFNRGLSPAARIKISGGATGEASVGRFPGESAGRRSLADIPHGRGKGIRVAVIDTGVRPHLDFMMPHKRIAGFCDFVNGRDEPYDDNGHGSAVAGILLGNGLVSGGLYAGSAPDAELVAIKALGSKGEGSSFHILEAMQWVYDNRERLNIRVLCMSFGTKPLRTDDPLAMGAEALWRSGIVVVASAGNSGPAKGTVTSPGSCPEIITVGAAQPGPNGEFVVPDFSSRGLKGKDAPLKPELVADGVGINCCWTNSHYAKLTGTSMAAPVVAGYAADLLSADPRLTPDRIKEILVLGALPSPSRDPAAGYGYARL